MLVAKVVKVPKAVNKVEKGTVPEDEAKSARPWIIAKFPADSTC